MINYNPKDWFTFIFNITRADTFRKLLPLMVAVAFYSWLIAFVGLNYFSPEASQYIRNVGQMHSVLGFVISLLLVFRTNTAYDRWWEGRKIWGGVTNSARNLAIKVRAMVSDPADIAFFRQMIPAYAFTLRNMLRENEDFDDLDPVLDLGRDKHRPNQLASRLYGRLNALHVQDKLTTAQFLVLDQEIKALTDHCGACERIKNTPIPFTYSVFIKKFIFFYVMTLPFGWTFSMGYYIIPVVVLILYALASLELIAEEIENPFGTDANDLPIDQICHNIRKHVSELLAD
jgi:putative membrane protein